MVGELLMSISKKFFGEKTFTGEMKNTRVAESFIAAEKEMTP